MSGRRLLAAFAFNFDQAVGFKAQVVIHAVARAVAPLFDRHLMAAAVVVDDFVIAEELAGNRIAAFGLDLAGAVIQADQVALATQGGGGLTERREQQAGNQQAGFH